MTIVTTHYRYKRPPRKRKPNPAALTMPRIVTAKKPKPRKPGEPPIRRTSDAVPSPDPAVPANDDRRSTTVTGKSSRHRSPDGQMAAEVNLSTFPSEAQAQNGRREMAVKTAENSQSPKEQRKSAIVTVRRHKHATLSHLLDDMTPEEHRQRGDAADALWREMKRRIAEKPTERS